MNKKRILHSIGYSHAEIEAYAKDWSMTVERAIEKLFNHERQFRANEIDLFADQELETDPFARGNQGKMF